MNSTTIRALQARIETTVEGVWGPASTAAMQSYLGASHDGARTWTAPVNLVETRARAF